MSTSNIDKALTVFRGMENRDKSLAVKYMHPTKYTEHNPQASDGIEGVKDWIDRLPPEKIQLQTIRALEDGGFVITHTTGDVFGPHVSFDIFRFEDGLIVEHWVFSEALAPPNKSGHTQTDGPTVPKRSEDRETNKALVREYYETVQISGEHTKIPHYASMEAVRHEPGVSDGLSSFLRDLKTLTQGRTIDEIRFVLGEGDLVFVAAKGTHDDKPCVYIDLYRVENAKLVEHWGFSAMIPPQKDSKNENGML